jgi:hypothetical protein
MLVRYLAALAVGGGADHPTFGTWESPCLVDIDPREVFVDQHCLVGERLAESPDVSTDDRTKLVDAARQDLDTTLRHLVDHNCRLLLQSHFDEGASRVWTLHMIKLRQRSYEPSWWGTLLTFCLVAQHAFLNLALRRQQREPDRQCMQCSYCVLAARRDCQLTIFGGAVEKLSGRQIG